MTTADDDFVDGEDRARTNVVTSFLQHNGEILLLRRSERVRTYHGRWAGVSGSIDGGRTPEQQARLEILEETTLNDDDVRLVAVGTPLDFEDVEVKRRWIVHPFRFIVLHPEKVRTDWEHVESRWIDPGDLPSFATVPKLVEAWESVKG
jgi:ADP-ribose pyrophosphatase YjhB (NUDIX family)